MCSPDRRCKGEEEAGAEGNKEKRLLTSEKKQEISGWEGGTGLLMSTEGAKAEGGND